MSVEMPEFENVLQGELLTQGDWIVAELEASLSWPVQPQRVSYLGTDFWLVPVSRESYPAVATLRNGLSLRETQSKMLRFLSAASWSESIGLNVVTFTGGHLPRVMRRVKPFAGVITADLDLGRLPEPQADEGRLALALMREGRSLNHPAYAFLSFYRVLEVAFPNGKQRGIWMEDAIDRLLSHSGREAVDALKTSGVTNIATHLQKFRRQAIAHAASQPIVDSDDANETEQLRAELPIIGGLAELAIEEIVGIKTSHTLWKEHLYELAGFKHHIGAEQMDRIMKDVELVAGDTIDLPEIDVELRRSDPFAPLTGMRPVRAAYQEQKLQLAYQSRDGLVEIEFVLDFPEERLRFEWNGGVRLGDDGTPEAAHDRAEINRFIRDYLGNGQLQIFNSENREMLSRLDAFIPVNFFSNPAAFDAEISRWIEEADRRSVLQP